MFYSMQHFSILLTQYKFEIETDSSFNDKVQCKKEISIYIGGAAIGSLDLNFYYAVEKTND